MGDVQGSSVLGFNYPRRKLTRCNYLGAILLGENCPGAIILGGNFPGEFSGGNCPEGNCARGIVLFPF